jgi:hypothetical protein
MMLPVGSTAPEFTLRDQNQQTVTISNYGGDKERAAGVLPRWRSPASVRAS